MKDEVKISMPLIDNIELQKIDNFYNDIVDEYIKLSLRKREQAISQRLMKNLREENEKLKKQLENTIEELELVRCDLHNRTSERNGAEKQNDLYKAQQQEFIKYLKQCIENEEYCYMSEKKEDRVRKDIFEEILSKYKEIIGEK